MDLNKKIGSTAPASSEADETEVEGDEGKPMDLGGEAKASAIRDLAAAFGVTVKDQAKAQAALTAFVSACASDSEDY
jgi:hypothetical protein